MECHASSPLQSFQFLSVKASQPAPAQPESEPRKDIDGRFATHADGSADRHFDALFELAEQAASGATHRIHDLARHVADEGSLVALELLVNLAATVTEDATATHRAVGNAAVEALRTLFHDADVKAEIKAAIGEQTFALKRLVEVMSARVDSPMASLPHGMLAFLDASATGALRTATPPWRESVCIDAPVNADVLASCARGGDHDALALRVRAGDHDALASRVRAGDHDALARLVGLACSGVPAPSRGAAAARSMTPVGLAAEAALLALVADPQVPHGVKANVRAAAYAHCRPLMHGNEHGAYARYETLTNGNEHGAYAHYEPLTNGDERDAPRPAGIPFALLYLAGRHARAAARSTDDHFEQAALDADYRRIGAFYNDVLANVLDWDADPLDRARMVDYVELFHAMKTLRHTRGDVLLQLDRGKLDPAAPVLADAVAGYDETAARIHERLLNASRDAPAVELAIVHDGDHWGVAVFRLGVRDGLDVSVFDSLNRWGMNLGVNLQDDTPNACAPLASLFAKAIDRRVGASPDQPLDVAGVFDGFVAQWRQLSPAQRAAMVEVERATMLARVADEVRAQNQTGTRLVTRAEFIAAAA